VAKVLLDLWQLASSQHRVHAGNPFVATQKRIPKIENWLCHLLQTSMNRVNKGG
jgi:hypothetical protein